MVLKFLTAGLISAVLAGGAIYLAMDEEMVNRLRSEAGNSRLDTPQPSDRDTPSGTVDGEEVVDRLLGRDATGSFEPDSHIDQPVEAGEPDSKRGWLDDILPSRESDRDRTSQSNATETLETLIAQAELISVEYARDDALYGILGYALERQHYGAASAVVEKLSTPELRDTGRQLIGVSHATSGRVEQAFAVLDEVETEALVDAIRLQIIQSVTTPTNIP